MMKNKGKKRKEIINWLTVKDKEPYKMKIIHVQSVLPQEDVVALKEKTGESSIKEAISKAVYHYLRCEKILEN